MGRRGGIKTVQCGQDGCNERAHYEYTSSADYTRLYKDQQRRPFMCSRHRNPEQLITPSNPTRSVTVFAERSRRFPDLVKKLFWRDGDAEDVGSGFMFGPGFKAYADDFPEGSRLVITITAELPTEGNSDGPI